MALDAERLSARITSARTDAGLTQQELAARTGLDRSALAKIEGGARRVSALELARIARETGQRMEWLLDEAPAAIVAHRVRRGSDTVAAPIDRELDRLARDVEFVESAGSSLRLEARDPVESLASPEDAEALAQSVRRELGLRDAEPALGLAELVAPLGFLLFATDLGSEAADGGTVHLAAGGVGLVNAASHLGRRRVTAAHELAHYLVADDYSVDWRVSEGPGSDRMEALLDRFARALLLPEAGLAEYWTSALADGERAAAVRAASHFRVDMSTLARRLVETTVTTVDIANRVRAVRTT